MCGIAGVRIDREGTEPPALDALCAMAGALAHRGPDEYGLYRDRRAGIAHARLSIIDLAKGQQPMSNAEGTLWIAFNGEIFNYVELRDELAARGRTFRTKSDTEVIVAAYEEWGEAAFERFNGQFAIALWDTRCARLTLVRDRLGVRPIYVCAHGGRTWFASEVKAIFAADPSVPRAFDPRGIDQVFTFWSTVAPRTVFLGIEEIEPGHVRTYDAGGMRDRAFWVQRFREHDEVAFRGTLDDAVHRVREALEEATRLRMVRSDVPVGSYLSGGLDSSLVAALGLAATGGRFKTFSLRFADAEYDETPFQDAMVRRLGSDHASIEVTRGDIARAFPDVVRHAERPILRTAPAPLFLLSGLVHREGIKVVLTGEGADEFFAGYDLFREARIRRFWARQPHSTSRPRLLERLYPYLQRSPVAQQAMARQFFGQGLERWREPGFGHALRWRSAMALRRLLTAEVRDAIAAHDPVADVLASLPPRFARWSHLAQDQHLEVRTLLSAYLLSSQGDRMLMAHSVEGRFPFLDPHVVALADSLPDRFKLAGLDEKHVLKRVAKGLVPDEIIERTKQPYRAPDALSFAGTDVPGWIGEAFDPDAITAAGVFDTRAAALLHRKLRDRGAAGQFSQADNMAVVGLLSIQLLHRQFVATRPSPGVEPTFTTLVDRA